MFETTVSWPTSDRLIDASSNERLDGFRIRTLVALSLLLAAIRIGSVASGPWDWDEALFALAVQGDYDITLHHPHPPGFPLYIAVARLIAPFVGAFPALQLIVVCSAIAIFPLMFFLTMEMGFSYRTSLVGAVLLASFPNVVIFGGSGFSDVPSLSLTLASLVFLLQGRRSPRAFIAGALVAALAAGIRVQSVIACAVPGLLASRYRRVSEVVRAAILATLVVGTIYGAAVTATGSFEKYQSAVAHHGEYIRTHDSFESLTRPPLGEVLEMVLSPWEAGDLGGVVLFFAAIALVDMVVNRHAPTAIALGTFGPPLVFAWLMLDPNSMSRFSISFMPLHAILAARGVAVAAGMLSGWLQVRRVACILTLGALLSVSMLVWVRSPVGATRKDEAPPVAAMQWVRSNLERDASTIWVESATLGPFAELELPGWDVRPFERWSAIALSQDDGRASWILVEGRHDDARATFSRTERHLRQLVRDRYFDVSVVPLDSTVVFGEGWYGQEGSGGAWWRWMQGDASIVIPGSMRERTLHLVLEYPTDTRGVVNVTFEIEGLAVDAPSRPVGGATDLVLRLSSCESERTLRIHVTPTVRPVDVGASGDPRVLGARLVVCELI